MFVYSPSLSDPEYLSSWYPSLIVLVDIFMVVLHDAQISSGVGSCLWLCYRHTGSFSSNAGVCKRLPRPPMLLQRVWGDDDSELEVCRIGVVGRSTDEDGTVSSSVLQGVVTGVSGHVKHQVNQISNPVLVSHQRQSCLTEVWVSS